MRTQTYLRRRRLLKSSILLGTPLTAPRITRYLSPRRCSGESMSRSEPDLEIVQGTLDLLVLQALVWGPRHGYAIARWIRETSEADLTLEDRALYLALHRLEDRDFVESDWGLSEANRRARYYQLTAAGKQYLRQRVSQWRRYSAAVDRILSAVRPRQ